MKRLIAGEKAPYSGTLIDDGSIVQMELEMTEGDICKRKLANSPCEITEQRNPAIWLLIGGFVGFGLTSFLSRK